MALSQLWRRRLVALASLTAVLTPTSIALAQQPAPPAGTPPPAPSAKTVPAKIATTDGKGMISIDDKVVGEGTFVGELTVGVHQLKITREGYETLSEQLVVSDGGAVNKNYTLSLSTNVSTENIVKEVDRPEGLYGGFVLHGFLTPGGTGNSIETLCDRKSEVATLTSCDTGGGLGGGIGGYFGYHWDPVGVELYVAGGYDSRSDKLTWASAQLTGGLQNNPARDEDFTIRRAGGMVLARIRLTKQWEKIRLTMPIGAGIAYRVMTLKRVATAKDGSNATDEFNSDASTYLSPAILIEPTVGYRITPGVAVTLGLQFSMEAPATFFNGNDNPVTDASRTHRLGLQGISTPSYVLASSGQVFIGPTLGMMFGP
jgi:hypothetical protein